MYIHHSDHTKSTLLLHVFISGIIKSGFFNNKLCITMFIHTD